MMNLSVHSMMSESGLRLVLDPVDLHAEKPTLHF
jgi:hypothetical protein